MQWKTDESKSLSLAEGPGIAEDLLESLTAAIQQVVPVQVEVQPYKPLENTVVQNEVGVLIGFTGELYGRILIQARDSTFGKLGESMFGVSLVDEMLNSFIGELANMIVGNASTIMCTKRRQMDISPPTVLVGQNHLYGFDNGVWIPVDLESIGEMQVILSLQSKGAA